MTQLETAKLNCMLAVYANRLRLCNQGKPLNSNITQFCKDAGVSRNLFYDYIQSFENIPKIAFELLKYTIEKKCNPDEALNRSDNERANAMLFLLDLIRVCRAEKNAFYIAAHTKYRYSTMSLLKKFICDVINSGCNEATCCTEEILYMKSLYLMDQLEDVVSINDNGCLYDKAFRMVSVLRAAEDKVSEESVGVVK